MPKPMLYLLLMLNLFSCKTPVKLNHTTAIKTKSEAPERKGFIDQKGHKQGMHTGTSGKFLYERAYKNDTLNGLFRSFTRGGTLCSTGYYEDNKRNGRWVEYHTNGEIASVENYKKGEKVDKHTQYYPNGQLKYEAYFEADTLLGEVTNYFENGTIEAKGNPRNGTWKTFHENGQIARIEQYKNGQLFGFVEKYDSSGVRKLPMFIAQKPADSTVVNPTELVVNILYETDLNKRILFFGEALFRHAEVCSNKALLSVRFGTATILIDTNGVQLYQASPKNCENEITPQVYRTNLITVEDANGEIDVERTYTPEKHQTSFGELTVNVQNLQCNDTGSNPVSLIHKGKELKINQIDNLEFFEFDRDQDNKNELYLLSYKSCMGYLKIYRIASH